MSLCFVNIRILPIKSIEYIARYLLGMHVAQVNMGDNVNALLGPLEHLEEALEI